MTHVVGSFVDSSLSGARFIFRSIVGVPSCFVVILVCFVFA